MDSCNVFGIDSLGHVIQTIFTKEGNQQQARILNPLAMSDYEKFMHRRYDLNAIKNNGGLRFNSFRLFVASNPSEVEAFHDVVKIKDGKTFKQVLALYSSGTPGVIRCFKEPDDSSVYTDLLVYKEGAIHSPIGKRIDIGCEGGESDQLPVDVAVIVEGVVTACSWSRGGCSWSCSGEIGTGQ